MDIKSASKAHNAEHVLDERTLTTEYYEPAAIPSSAAGAPSAGSSPAGSGYSGSSSSVNSTPAPVTSTRHPTSSGEDATSTASVAAAAAAAAAAAVVATAAAPANWRGTNDSATDYCRRSSNASNYTRVRSSAPYSSTPPPPSVDKTSNQRWYSGSGSVAGGGGGESTPSTPGGATDGGAGARRRAGSGSGGGSSRSDSSSPEPSDTSRASSPRASQRHNHRTHSNQYTSSASGRPLAICVRNLPTRSTDSSLKDGLYHEYKKHGKVVWVKVVGQNADRYAIVRFVKPSDVEKALEVSQDKLFFGCKISVAPHQSCDEDAESVKPYETDIDEYHPKATRTLFIGNLEKDVTQQQLRDKFKNFGRIIEIDIKKGSSGGAGYAFCQYASISSVVEAIRAMDGEYVGSSRVKLGFGKPVATTCVWVDGLTEHTEKQVLGAVSRCGAALSVCVDRAAGAALVHFEQAAAARSAVRELRRVAALATHDRDPPPDAPRLCVDYASRECQEAFYEQLEKHGGSAALAGSERLSSETRYIPASRHDQIRVESVGSGSGSRPRSDSYSRGSSRTPRLEPSEPATSPPPALPALPALPAERRCRYDELGSTPPPDELYEERLQSVVNSPHRSRRHRRDSSPEEHKIKEWHRSVVGTSGGVVCTVTGTRRLSGDARHRSRSGSRRRHRRRRDESVSRGGTPLRDEPDGAATAGPAPCEPRRPSAPRDRSVPMMLPLPKFALQLRAQQLGAGSSAAPHPPAPASPARPPPPPPPPAPPDSDSSSAGSAPHSPSASASLEERIRSLDEKYERWSRLDPPAAPPVVAAAAASPALTRVRSLHHLLDVDINEVKPSDVVRSLLAKRSVFDSDSERLEGTVRPPTPPSAAAAAATSTPRPRSLIHPFPTHDRIHPETPSSTIFDSSNKDWANLNVKNEQIDSKCDTKPKVEKSFLTERLFQNSDSENASEPILRLRTPSLDKAPENLSPKNSANSNAQDCKVQKDTNREHENVKEIACLSNTHKITTKTEIEDANVKESSIEIMQKDNTDSVLCMESIPLNEIPLPSCEKNPDHLTASKRTMETFQFRIKEEKLDEVLCLPENHLPKLTKVEIEINDEISKMIQQQSSEDSVHTLVSSDINECGIKTADIPLPASDPPVIKKDLVIKKEPFSKELEDIPIPIKRVNDIKNEIAEAKQDCITVVKNNNAKTQDLPTVSSKVQVKENLGILPFSFEKQSSHFKINDSKSERDKSKCNKDKSERDRHEFDREKHKSVDKKHEKDRCEKDKRSVLDEPEKRPYTEKLKSEKDKIDYELEKYSKDKHDRDHEKSKHEEKSRHEHCKKDKRKDSVDCIDAKPKKDEKSRHEKHRKEHGKDHGKEHVKDHSKEHVKEHGKEFVKEHCKEHVKDHSKDNVKEHNKEHVKEHSKEHVKEHSKEHVKEHSKEHVKEHSKEHSKEHVKEHSKEHVKEHSKENVKEHDSKRETRKENDSKSRKSSRDESSSICRKDSTDSATSRASHDSHKTRELDTIDNKDENHHKSKVSIELSTKVKVEKELIFDVKHETPKVKSENDKKLFLNDVKIKQEHDPSARLKSKSEAIDKRHHSLDSPSVDNKRKERLASCSSLPPNVGLKRRLSAQESYDSIQDDNKRVKHESKHPERRSSKDSRCIEKSKTKFNKCHFAKLIESKTKDERKNQVKIENHFFQIKSETKVHHTLETTKPDKKSPKRETDERPKEDVKPEALRNDFDFLALLELRSSEEDEKQKALRNEMKEKKRIQQLQQIHELQMQQDAFQQQQQHVDLLKKNKVDEKRKEAAREKRFSTDRKSRDEKCDQPKRKSSHRKLTNSTDTSDSDEPKKHSIFDIVDDGPTYISMYDKVKARSCKNMQKQEEEKRQEKIKARFSQLKQSRAKREEKKRSSWDEDSDSEHDRKHSLKTSVTSSSEDDHKKSEKMRFDSDKSLTNDYFMTSSLEDEHRNKQSRKNSRSRIMSDTSDDDNLKRNVERMSNICDQVKKELAESESYSSEMSRSNLDKCYDMPAKEVSADRIKKNSLLNLFGKTDIEENKVKLLSGDVDEYKTKNLKKITDISSESESMLSISHNEEKRKKHKKKARNPKSSPSSEEPKENVNAALQLLTGIKHNNLEKSSINCIKTHMNKILENERHNDFDTLRKAKCFTNDENNAEITAHSVRKDGKMEDIFGPLSDDSDYTMFNHYDDKPSVFNSNYDKRHPSDDNEHNHYSKERENIKRRKERRRKEKEKRHTIRDDDNSLDVDAVGRAIEARLFADVDNGSRMMDSDREDPKQDHVKKYIEEPKQDNIKKYNEDLKIIENLGNDKFKRDAKEKKKKKKRSRDDRQNRREHHHHSLKLNHVSQHHRHKATETKDKLLDNINLFQSKQQNDYDKVVDKKILESASLPFITDNPPVSLLSEESKEPKSPEAISNLTIDESMDVPSLMKETETKEIVLSSPTSSDDQDKIPPEPTTTRESSPNKDNLTTINTTDNANESAVRSISNIDSDLSKSLNLSETSTLSLKSDEKEKPRAVISQEETEDAVAALLGESFGDNNKFNACYDEEKDAEIECPQSSPLANENIPEVDAEEMRQAVQNLNASEMEMKPDTPVSDSDLLLIDTDTEETEEQPSEPSEKLSVTTGALPGVVIPRITPAKNLPNVQEGPNKLDIDPTKSVPEPKQIKPDIDIKASLQQPISSATAVITSWTLTNKSLHEPQMVSLSKSNLAPKEGMSHESRPIATNITQLKSGPMPSLAHNVNTIRPILGTQLRAGAPYQVSYQMVHAQLPKLQPPTIKIPEPHIMYQKPQGIVLSPRMSNDPRLHSPKSNALGLEGLHSPRLANMTILSTSPQNFNPVGLSSPKNIQQRSPGQVTVVRMQQPPLSPIQAMSLGNNRAMISPNRPNSVLVQTQGTPIHFNRLATPVLAPISKPIGGNIVQANKGIPVSLSQMSHQIPLQLDSGKDPRINMDGNHENTKIIFSSSNLQQSTNPTIMAQNRLISMQNLHVGNMNPALHMPNKVILNKVPSIPEKPDHKNACFTPDNKRTEHNSFTYAGSPLIHVAGMNKSAHIIQNAQKITVSDGNISREQMPNVIHSMNSSRLLTTAPISNIIQVDANKGQPSVLTMATIRHPSVLTKINSSNASVVTTSSLTNVLMTPLLLKTGTPFNSVNVKLPESDNIEHRGLHVVAASSLREAPPENFDAPIKRSPIPTELGDRRKELYISAPLSSFANQNVNKCDTDFEELLKDKTSEIKVINDLQKNFEINVGKPTAVTSKPADEVIKSNITTVANERPVEQEVLNDLMNLKETECKSHKNHVILKTDEHLNTNKKNHIHEFSDFSHHNKDDPIAKNIDENDPWSATDVNIDSVIKKVDSLCNENIEEAKVQRNDPPSTSEEKQTEVEDKSGTGPSPSPSLDKQSETVSEDMDIGLDENFDKNGSAKRGGRSVRGKKTNKLDRVQTRQIAKPARGGSAAKRGRGRGNSEKRIKSASNANPSNLPGDVYDFHEDSGDETSSQNNNESRPRLILTIKSPLAGQPNATSTLTATTKDPLPKLPEKVLAANKDEKGEDFASPSLNTRKSRRLQEKDVQKPEECTDEKAPSRGPKDTKKRPTRQAGSKVNYSEKTPEKTPPKVQRGVKRTRDRSISDASMDSSDEKASTKKEDGPVAAKVLKVAESLQVAAVAATTTVVATKPEPQHQLAAQQLHMPQQQLAQQPHLPAQQSHLPSQQPHLPALPQPQPHLPSQPQSLPQPLSNKLQPHPQPSQQYPQSQTPAHHTQSQPIISQRPPQQQLPAPKPTVATIASTAPTTNTPIMKPPKKMISEISAKLASAFEAAASSRGPEPMFESIVYGRACLEEGLPAAATGEARSSMPQGALEAAAARVQSPALPHRAPYVPPHRAAHTPRPPDRAGPSLPRGAHHPPPPARLHHHEPAHQRLPVHHASTARMTVTNVPHVSPGQIGVGDGIYPHFSHQHYQVYQQHFRATQHEARASPIPYTRTLEAEGSEAPGPPLELRRPPALAAAPPERLILYGSVGGRSPPPAHRAAGPPHASQVPREADSLQMLLRRYPVMWQGLLALKNDCAAVQMHFVGGNPGVAGGTLPRHTDGSTPPLRIAQRMRLEPAQLDQVHRKMKLENEHCILLALPCGRDHMDVLQQSTNLTAGFITYLQRKQAAGIVNVAPPGHQQAMYTVHIFPSCDFANENLNRIAPDLMHRVADIAHLLIVIATV